MRSRTTKLLLPAVLLTTVATAQSPLRATRNLGTPITFANWGVAAGDLDGDGDVDLVTGGGSLTLLANDGRGRFVDATAGNLPPGAYVTNAVDLADIDGDGDLDLLVANEGNLQNRILINDGTGAFLDVTASQMPVQLDFSLGQVVADFDGDGDLDWFVSNGDPDVLYRNDGSGVFTDVSASSLPANVSTGYHVFAVDIDGDGDLDLFSSVSGSLPSVLLNDGTGVFTAPAVAVPTSGFRCHAADFDGDGLPDLFTDEGTNYRRNLGGLTFAPPVALPFPTRGAVDLDGDGDLDLLAEGMVFRNDGNGGIAQLVTPGLTFGYLARFAAADFDGDGDLDVMLGAYGSRSLFTNLTTQLETPSPAERSQPWSIICQTTQPTPTTTPSLFALGFAFQDLSLPTPFGVLRIDLAQGYLVESLLVSGGAAARSWTIPNDLGLIGVELNLQAMVATPNRPLFLSNAVRDIVQ